MEEPWSSVVRDEPESNVIPWSSHAYGVSPDWVNEVRCAVACNSNNGKFVLLAALERRTTQKTKA